MGDNLSSHLSSNVTKKFLESNIKFILSPANSSHICQPLEVSYFRPLKAWRKQLMKWKLVNKGTVPKAQFLSLFKRTEDSSNHNQPEIIKSGFRAYGISPLDKEQLWKRLPRPNINLDESAQTTALQNHLQTRRYADRTSNEYDDSESENVLKWFGIFN